MDSQTEKGEKNIVPAASLNQQSPDLFPDHRGHRRRATL